MGSVFDAAPNRSSSDSITSSTATRSLAYDSVVPARDESGKPVTHWDGVTKKTNPITGEEVPDESARRPSMHYSNARRAEWPDARFIVGNPPFLGNWRMRGELDSGYAETLRAVYSEVPESADHVMYWWHRAAELVRSGKVRRFGFITTNSLRQTFQRRVITPHLTDPKTPCLTHLRHPGSSMGGFV